MTALLTATNPQAVRLAQEGAALAQAGKLTDGLARYEDAAKLAPQDASIVFNLAQLREATGDRAGAAEAYQRYLSLSPGASDAADVKARLERLTAPVTAAPVAVPDEARAALARAQALFKMERIEESETAFREASRLAPTWGAPFYNLGVVAETRKRWADAVAAFRRYKPLSSADERAELEQRIAEDEIRADDERKVQQAEAERQAAARLQAEREATAREEEARLDEEHRREAGLRAQEQRRLAAIEDRRWAQVQSRDAAAARRITGIVGWGVAVGGVALSITGMVLGLGNNTRIQAGGFAKLSELTEAESTGRTFNILAFAGLALAGAGLIGGSLLYFLSPDPGEPTALHLGQGGSLAVEF